MLQGFLNWISGGLIGALSGPLLDAYKARLAADNDNDKLVANERIALITAEMESNRNAAEIRKATSGFPEMRILTVLIAAPFILHVWLVGLDTSFGFGWRIAKFPPPFDEWEGAILLSFFGVSVIGVGVKALAGAIAFRRK
jgi:hypothetical protein